MSTISPFYRSYISQLGCYPRYLEMLPSGNGCNRASYTNYVLLFFKNWILANFLKWIYSRLSISRPIWLLMWYNLFAVVFIPILLLLFLKIWNINCLHVQMIWSITVMCSKLRTLSCSFKSLCNLSAIWWYKICLVNLIILCSLLQVKLTSYGSIALCFLSLFPSSC